jgi:hypothetical protein
MFHLVFAGLFRNGFLHTHCFYSDPFNPSLTTVKQVYDDETRPLTALFKVCKKNSGEFFPQELEVGM